MSALRLYAADTQSGESPLSSFPLVIYWEMVWY